MQHIFSSIQKDYHIFEVHTLVPNKYRITNTHLIQFNHKTKSNNTAGGINTSFQIHTHNIYIPGFPTAELAGPSITLNWFLITAGSGRCRRRLATSDRWFSGGDIVAVAETLVGAIRSSRIENWLRKLDRFLRLCVLCCLYWEWR